MESSEWSWHIGASLVGKGLTRENTTSCTFWVEFFRPKITVTFSFTFVRSNNCAFHSITLYQPMMHMSTTLWTLNKPIGWGIWYQALVILQYMVSASGWQRVKLFLTVGKEMMMCDIAWHLSNIVLNFYVWRHEVMIRTIMTGNIPYSPWIHIMAIATLTSKQINLGI